MLANVSDMAPKSGVSETNTKESIPALFILLRLSATVKVPSTFYCCIAVPKGYWNLLEFGDK